uniref:Uncharacterized protein n=1 Tax=Cucumis melo TaxID=3656 RepID=A0A9I9D7B8_CUCME
MGTGTFREWQHSNIKRSSSQHRPKTGTFSVAEADDIQGEETGTGTRTFNGVRRRGNGFCV